MQKMNDMTQLLSKNQVEVESESEEEVKAETHDNMKDGINHIAQQVMVAQAVQAERHQCSVKLNDLLLRS